MPKLLSIKNFLGVQTIKRKLPPQYAREIQDMVSERGLTKTRSGFTKYNTDAFLGIILGIFDYRRKSGQLVGQLFGQLFTVWYEANELPTPADPPWIMDIYIGDESQCSISNGILTVGPDVGDNIAWKRPTSQAEQISGEEVADNDIGNIMEASVKMGEGSPAAFMQISDGPYRVNVGISKNFVQTDSSHRYYLDTTDTFHTYRLTLKGLTVNVFVDGVLRISDEPYDGESRSWFFWGVNTIAGDTQWDYVRYYTGGF